MAKCRDESVLQVNWLQYRPPRIGVVVVFICLLTAIAKRVLAMASNVFQDTNGVLAVITDSGSTNKPGSTITINRDGSGSVIFQRSAGERRFGQYVNKTFPPNTFESNQLETILTQINDVDTIPKHNCIKSISFGSVTTITYQGKTSGDLNCLSGEDPQIFLDLKNLVQRIRAQA
jgi:hypothetical protein